MYFQHKVVQFASGEISKFDDMILKTKEQDNKLAPYENGKFAHQLHFKTF